MRAALAVFVVLALGQRAAAEPAQPIRVAIQCEDYGRTKACSAFLVAMVEANKLFLSAPRADADVVLYANANEIALVDRIHLRFVGKIAGAPPVIELDIDLDTRVDDDAQRAQLEPGFLRGIALYVAARHPGAVTVALAAPDELAVKAPKTTPFGFAFELGSSGNYTENYQAYSGYVSGEVTRVTARDLASLSAYASGGIIACRRSCSRTAPRSRSTARSGSSAVTSAPGTCTADAGVRARSTRVFRDDDKGQFRYNWKTRAGVEWDRFKADDPRGNRLSIMYLLGYVVERYNVRNDIGENFAQYPTHELIASGNVRKDKVNVGLSDHATRRDLASGPASHARGVAVHRVAARRSCRCQRGVLGREARLPGSDPTAIDPSDYAQLSRLSYADPLQINGYFNVRIHWDRTNGARNDRFTGL